MLTAHSWRIVGVSVEGTSHQKSQTGCQDAYEYRQVADDIFILAIADGAGSAKRASEGACVAVRTACISMEKALAQGLPTTEEQWKILLTGVLIAVRATLEERVMADLPHILPLGGSLTQEEEGSERCLDDLATTLTLAVISPDFVAGIQVGDGTVVGLIEGADAPWEVRTLMPPHHGEYINETTFVTGPDYLSQAQYVCCARETIQGIALLTDGVTPLGLEDATGCAHAPFFEALFSFVSQGDSDTLEGELAQFLLLPRVCERTNDDKTIVMAVITQPWQEEIDIDDEGDVRG